MLGLADLPSLEQVTKRMSWVRSSALLMWLLICATTAEAMPALYVYYQTRSAHSESDEVQQIAKVVADLRKATTQDDWVITDGQFLVALADRNTPPALTDTSFVRISTGYLTTQQLVEAASDPRVKAVLFSSDRLASKADFHGWVAQHFPTKHSYAPMIELWIR